jgi:hypothetical protein
MAIFCCIFCAADDNFYKRSTNNEQRLAVSLLTHCARVGSCCNLTAGEKLIFRFLEGYCKHLETQKLEENLGLNAYILSTCELP